MGYKIKTPLLVFILLTQSVIAAPSPSLVGWTNLFIPGAGSALRGDAGRGLGEAVGEIGLYVAGAIGNRNDSFTIDGAVNVEDSDHLTQPIVGTMLQQAGIKIHFYNTFYHYQRATFEAEKLHLALDNPQPIYRGDVFDVLSAPFRGKNLANPWVWGLIVASSVYLLCDYHNSPVDRRAHEVSAGNDFLFGVSQVGVIPLGSAFGEEPLFRGFMQREFYGASGSIVFALIAQSALAAAIHPPDERLSALFGGIYSGILTQYYDGDLGPAIASHFWIDVIDGIVTYLVFHRSQGKDTPFAPPINMNLSFRF